MSQTIRNLKKTKRKIVFLNIFLELMYLCWAVYVYISLPQFNANSLHIAPRRKFLTITKLLNVSQYVSLLYFKGKELSQLFQCISIFNKTAKFPNYMKYSQQYKDIIEIIVGSIWTTNMVQPCILRYWIGLCWLNKRATLTSKSKQALKIVQL